MKKNALLLFVLLLSGALKAQETCVEKLYNANRLFEKGQITEAIDIAKTCAIDNNSVADQWQAYYLLAIAYLVNNQRSEARKAAEKMMELNPTYKPGSRDPGELVSLLRSVKVIPKFTLGVAATVGGNLTFPNINATYNGASYTKEYTGKGSWQMGLIIGYNMNEIISLHTGLIASSKKYNINYSLEGKDVEVKENLTYFDLPLYARFTGLPKKKLRVFGEIGFYTGRLAGAKSSFSIKDTATLNISSENINSESRRNKWEYGILAGAGLVYKYNQLNISLDIRYYLASYYNVTNKNKRYENTSLFYNYYFLDDDFRLNNLALSISVVQTLNYKVLKTKGDK